MLIIGTETGFVIGCTTLNFTAYKPLNTTKTNSKEIEHHEITNISSTNCVRKSYGSLIGAVNCVSVSPFDNQLFLTACTDGSVKLYNIQKSEPLNEWEPCSSGINSVSWSNQSSTVFSCLAANNVAYIYDLSVIYLNLF